MKAMGKEVESVYHFESHSSPGTYHETLRYKDGSLSCGCRAWVNRVESDGSRTCPHVRLVAAGHGESSVVPIAPKSTKPFRAQAAQLRQKIEQSRKKHDTPFVTVPASPPKSKGRLIELD